MKIGICTCGVFNPPLHNQMDYVSVTDRIKAAYCKKFGHEFISSKESAHEDRDAHFARFALLLYALAKLECDWVVWMDCDAAPVNFNVDIADFLSKMDPDKVVIRKDVLGWNSGVFAVPRTEKAINWLLSLDSQETYDKFVKARFQDQDAIAASFEHPEYKDFYQIPPDDFGFNQYDNIYQWYPDPIPNEYIPDKSWCLHVAGYGDSYRKLRFGKILDRLSKSRCPVCRTPGEKYFTVPFDKTFKPVSPDMPLQGGECTYDICPHCRHIYAPMFADWTPDDYQQRIYNGDFDKYVDPEHASGQRDKQMFEMFKRVISVNQSRVLDYGGGHGGFAKMIHDELGLWADSYDPFYGDKDFKHKNKYSLITCFEVLEHVYDPHRVFEDFAKLLVEDGVVIMSTQIWDKALPLELSVPTEWETACPRNGHVCVYSSRALEFLCTKYGFRYCKDRSTEYFQVLEKI
jgi:hypothetical protein